MPDKKVNMAEAFDFSKDAAEFRARLWEKLCSEMAEHSVQPLEDDDLEWVNAAAGIEYRAEKDEFNK